MEKNVTTWYHVGVYVTWHQPSDKTILEKQIKISTGIKDLISEDHRVGINGAVKSTIN